MFKETRNDDNSTIKRLFAVFVRKLLYVNSSIKAVQQILNYLSKEIGDLNEFKLLFEQITNESRKLLNLDENVRVNQEKVTDEELFTANQLLIYSQGNDQLLTREANYKIYLKILGQNAKHSKDKFGNLMVNIKNKVKKSIETKSIDQKRANEIKEIIKEEYNRLVEDENNHFNLKEFHSPELSYAIFYLQELNKEFNRCS